MVTVIVDGDDASYAHGLRKRLPSHNVTMRTRVTPNAAPGGFPFAIRFDRRWEVVAKRVGTDVVDLIDDIDLEDLADLGPPASAIRQARNPA